eukprot:TRINITY_DN74475_c0_g1_i1.p1 TRINITY_DN74475_c0_g1~~TRINITY_DN74475_c0_g1_i1.p1  ORF type:complete len:268 (-),score=27.94 TRINITY_DN74475_c0_g1_i1:394-1197(-)
MAASEDDGNVSMTDILKEIQRLVASSEISEVMIVLDNLIGSAIVQKLQMDLEAWADLRKTAEHSSSSASQKLVGTVVTKGRSDSALHPGGARRRLLSVLNFGRPNRTKAEAKRRAHTFSGCPVPQERDAWALFRKQTHRPSSSASRHSDATLVKKELPSDDHVHSTPGLQQGGVRRTLMSVCSFGLLTGTKGGEAKCEVRVRNLSGCVSQERSGLRPFPSLIMFEAAENSLDERIVRRAAGNPNTQRSQSETWRTLSHRHLRASGGY